MTATEARQLSEANKDVPFQEVILRITEAAKSGRYEVWFHNNEALKFKERLESLGYTLIIDEKYKVRKVKWGIF